MISDNSQHLCDHDSKRDTGHFLASWKGPHSPPASASSPLPHTQATSLLIPVTVDWLCRFWYLLDGILQRGLLGLAASARHRDFEIRCAYGMTR